MIFYPNDNFDGLLRHWVEYGYPHVEINNSKADDESHNINSIFNYSNTHVFVHFVTTGSVDSFPYIQVHLKYAKFQVTHYSLWSHDSDSHYMRNWKLEGRTDENEFIVLDSKNNCTDLINSSNKTYPINENNGYYSYFKLSMTGPTGKDWSMRIKHFELFGILANNITHRQKFIIHHFLMFAIMLKK